MAATAAGASGAGAGAGQAKLQHLLPAWMKDEVKRWLADDVPGFDIGGMVVGERVEEALLLGKSDGVLAGVPFVNAVFELLDCKIEWYLQEGEVVKPVKIVAKVTGKVRNILLGERTALNIITRASGIATAARELADMAAAAGWTGHVAGTRKTTPGFRLVEKYALVVGGISTHRMNLSSMVMLKDNHVWSTGGITAAVKSAQRAAGFSTKIEVECRNYDEAVEAATAGADIVMLDNYKPEELKPEAARLKKRFPSLLIEASGGIRKNTIARYFSPHVDVLSMGALTQGYSALDFSLKIARKADAATRVAAAAEAQKRVRARL